MIITNFLHPLIKEAEEAGQHWAHSSAALFLSSGDADYLESAAKALARRLPSTPFDPSLCAEDKLQEDAYQKTLHDLDDVEMALVNVEAALRQREGELADLGHRLPQPQPPLWLTCGGTALFAGTLLISIYDWTHERISDPYLSLLAALAPCIALGVFVVRSLTHSDSPQQRQVGLIAGIGISLATGVLRYALAPDEWIMAAALTLAELFIVFFLD